MILSVDIVAKWVKRKGFEGGGSGESCVVVVR